MLSVQTASTNLLLQVLDRSVADATICFLHQGEKSVVGRVAPGQDPDRPDYVSRGGHKLAGALAAFTPRGLVVAGRRCLDAGASTGGFTDVLLRAGAAQVVAVDVGYGQLAWTLRSDDRVVVRVPKYAAGVRP